MSAVTGGGRQPWLPKAMTTAPVLAPDAIPGPMRRRYALLINPFYRKDPHASFGKHVLTPTLALTTIAAATPAHWEVRYWDENLLQGPPPLDPFPEVVGITVHLTFAKRAYELARWYRAVGREGRSRRTARAVRARRSRAARGCARARRRRAALAANSRGRRGRHACSPSTAATTRKPYRDDPPPRRDLLPRDSFLTTTSVIATRGCHNRCGFCYLSTEGLHMPYRMRDVEQVVAELAADGQPYAVFVDNNLGSRPDYLRELCRALRPLEIIWSAAVTIDVTDDPTLVREMALAGCTGVFIGFESLNDGNLRGRAQAHAGPRRLRAPRRDPARQRHPGERQLRARLRSRRPRRVREDGRVDRGEPTRVRDVPHPDAVSRHAAVRAAREARSASCIATGASTTRRTSCSSRST